MESAALSEIGLVGLGAMGQNLALNIAEKGIPISVYNRTISKVDETLHRAHPLPLSGHYTPKDLLLSIKKPRSIIILVNQEACERDPGLGNLFDDDEEFGSEILEGWRRVFILATNYGHLAPAIIYTCHSSAL